MTWSSPDESPLPNMDNTAAENADRRPTRRRSDRPVTFTRRGPFAAPPFEAVTSAAVVAVTVDGRLVLADLARGLDIPGGHVRRDETSAEETARREVWEETRAEVGELQTVEVIESDYFGSDDLTYMIIYAARVTRLAPWRADHESAGRVLLEPEEFLSGFRGTDPDLMRHLVTQALVALQPDRPRTGSA
jgi:8-oxo-dGTP diphosphatase